MSQKLPAARPEGPRDTLARTTELPRARVDTRMPPAPAPGGRIIAVDPPRGRARKGGLDFGFLAGAMAIAASITIVWRLLKTHRTRRHLL